MLENSSPRIERVLFRNNRAEVAGGGLYWTVSGPDMVITPPQNMSPESPPKKTNFRSRVHTHDSIFDHERFNGPPHLNKRLTFRA